MDGYRFTSPLFRVEAGEDLATNPGIYGKQLAHWLGERLAREGYDQPVVIAEDWGWCVQCAAQPVPVWVGCANDEDSEEGAAMPDHRRVWRCFAVVEPGLLARLFGGAVVKEQTLRIRTALERVLAGEPLISFVDEA
ncbi:MULTISPECIES: hypothetical protein [Dyella]|uniref:Uncharacterized protein n=2 Tax=Dyella TaxID=231454 RepID=A0A4R0YTL0_9GAMM|nr:MULTISPECIES: hypothetical protein [Dyella]TBR39848.1 hypothetical protein EYV96_06595 [Dyella terrae]TCI12572.1 hypothetical protein EZM97_04275 [Dyella soli]